MEFAALRDEMVDSLEHDTKAVVEAHPTGRAMRAVPRHEFVDEEHRAYTDQSFRHRDTTILSPSTAGRLLSALAPEAGDNVLVVGVGVGYLNQGESPAVHGGRESDTPRHKPRSTLIQGYPL
jgi:protein-L-isoaspartate(D-aspartate) O-methyltransferase